MTFFVNVKQWRERLRGRERHTHTHSLLGKIFVHLRHEKSSHSAAGLNTVIWRSLSLPRAGKCHCVPDTQILGNQVNPSFFRREPNPSAEQWWDCSSYNLLAAHHLLRWLLGWDGRVRPVMGSSTAFPAGDKTEGPWDISHTPFSTSCCWWKEQGELYSTPCRASCWEQRQGRTALHPGGTPTPAPAPGPGAVCTAPYTALTPLPPADTAQESHKNNHKCPMENILEGLDFCNPPFPLPWPPYMHISPKNKSHSNPVITWC